MGNGMKKARIAVFVSGGGTNLQALMDAEDKGILKSGEIVLVLASNPTAYALERAKSKNIPTAVAWKSSSARRKPLRPLSKGNWPITRSTSSCWRAL